MTQSSKTKSYISANPGNSWWGLFKRMKLGAQVSMIISLILILAGAFGLVFLQSSLLEESQDIRQQAAVEDGQIVITSQLREDTETNSTNTSTDATTSGALTFDENILDLYIDTNELQTNTIRLVFEVWPTNEAGEASTISAITQAPDFEVNPELGLQISDQEIEQNGAGYLVAVTLEPINPSATFSTQEVTQLASVRFQYLSEQAARELLNSDTSTLPGVSISYDNDESLVYTYGTNPPEDELKYIARNTFTQPVVNTDEEDVEEVEEELVDNEEETNDEDEEEIVLVNDQDDENQVSKGGQRIETVSCNETCASNHQCDAGLACYSGRCRNPLNLQSSSCSEANPTTTATMAERCSQACETHRDCPANMLCHAASQSCRLATNPGSLSCSPATAKTVSAIYDSNGTQSGGTDSTAGAQTDTATISGSVLEQIEAERAEQSAQEQGDATASGSVGSQKLGIPLFGIFVPINVLLGGLIALGALICVLVILTMRGKSQSSGSQFVAPKRVLTPEEHAAHQKATQEIKDKISALQKVEAHTKSEVATHVAQRPNMANASHTPNTVFPPKPGMPNKSSMLERIKQKNIATPQSPTQPTNNS